MNYEPVLFPLWMGAGVRTRVPAGARALRGTLGKPLEISVPDPEGTVDLEKTDLIRAKPALLEAFARAAETLAPLGRVALLGGDCSSDLPLLAASSRRHGPNLAVIWLDTHADLNTPQSSPSGHFHGMVLRAALGDTDPDFLRFMTEPLRPRQVFLGGARDFDPPELEYIQKNAISVFSPESLRPDPSTLARAVRDAGFSRVHVHLDLDVLDARDFTSTGFSSSGGLRLAELGAVIQQIKRQLEVVSFAVTEYAPAASDDDLETVLGLIRALEG